MHRTPRTDLLIEIEDQAVAQISGWCKEGSYHNPTGGDIAPLPFREMSGYPPLVVPGSMAHRDWTSTRRIARVSASGGSKRR